MAVILPNQLSFYKRYRKAGLRASKSLAVSFPGKHVMLLRARSSSGVTSISVTVRGRALHVSSALRKRLRKHPKQKITIIFAETGGRVVTRHKTVRAR